MRLRELGMRQVILRGARHLDGTYDRGDWRAVSAQALRAGYRGMRLVVFVAGILAAVGRWQPLKRKGGRRG